MYKMKSRVSIILPIAIVSLIIVFASFGVSLEYFSVSNKLMAQLWLGITNIGGVAGSGIILLLTALFISIIRGKFKWKYFLMIFVVFSGIFIGVAQINEHFIKEQIKAPRPNIEWLSEFNKFSLEEMYSLHSKKERTEYLKNVIAETNQSSIVLGDMEVQPIIWKHWLKETGYSFPSGHSVNAFLMAFLISYIFLLRFSWFNKYGVVTIYLIALLIAYSRVLLGVHTNLDISLGALWGTIIGIGIVYTGLFDYLDSKNQANDKKYKS